jgi:hypothetical protein
MQPHHFSLLVSQGEDHDALMVLLNRPDRPLH